MWVLHHKVIVLYKRKLKFRSDMRFTDLLVDLILASFKQKEGLVSQLLPKGPKRTSL